MVFTRDTVDRITKIANGLDGSMTQTFGYDALSRLINVSSGADNESYSYDADGNRTYQVVNGNATSFDYEATSNRLESSSGGMNAAYGYDADGNTVNVDGHTAYTYGPFDRLVNAGGTDFLISAEGQRIEKTGASGAWYFAPGAGGLPLADDELGHAWNDYVWLNGKLVALIDNGTVYAVHDELGRAEAITNPATVTVWRASNYPFTRRVTGNALGAFNLGFPGQYYDSEDGLWHNGYRDYDASLGRYIESDPIGLAGGINTYAYVGNNPISNADPLGLYCLKEWQIDGIAGAAVGGALGAAAGSETGPGAAITGLAGAVINGGLGALGGLLETSQANGAVLGAAGALAASGSRSELAGAGYGGALGGAVSSQLENNGYPPGVALPAGGAVGGSVGAVIGGYFKGLTVSGMLTSGLKGGGIGLAAGAVQAGLEAALRAGNSCGCKQ